MASPTKRLNVVGDGEEHVSQPSVCNRDEVFADQQKRTPVEQSPLYQE